MEMIHAIFYVWEQSLQKSRNEGELRRTVVMELNNILYQKR